MASYEQQAEAFERLVQGIGLDPDPTFSEADTRAKIIDRILTEALGWPQDGSTVLREEHVHEGYIDYALRTGLHGLVIEAKRTGSTFSIPEVITHDTRLSVKHLLKKQAGLRLMYDQVASYAHQSGIEFCVLSNGTQWLIFPGVRTDNIHVRNSRVVVFNGLKSILANFVDFWKLLSFESVAAGSLRNQFEERKPAIEPSYVFNTDARLNVTYDRNPLSLALVDVLPKYFGDLHGDPASTDLLRECMVLDSSAQRVLGELGIDSDSEAPLSLAKPILHFYSLPQVAQQLEALLKSFLLGDRDTYFQVLLGRVGIGKTTFLTYCLDIAYRDLLKDHFALRLDLREITEQTDLEAFFVDRMSSMMWGHKKYEALISDVTLKKVYARDIELLTNGPLAGIKRIDPQEYEKEISRFLGRQVQETITFLKRASEYLYRERFARFVIVFDNVDQLDLDMQQKVIRFAFAKMREYHAFVMLSMWEETYFASKRGAHALSTIRTVPIQIARQSITSVLVKRLSYLIRQVEAGSEKLPLLDEAIADKQTFCKFIELILRSLVVDNRRVKLFLELVGLGNIRRALEMFHAFLTAGSLETGKVIELMRKNRDYLVPVHEFVKSVMLGSKRFYSERTSEVLNLFSIGDAEQPSHFTRLRILQWLYERRYEATTHGAGFRLRKEMIGYFKGIGASEKDVLFSIMRMTESGLLENELRAVKNTELADAVRITPAGRYYLSRLHTSFPYMDLVMQDTPMYDIDIYKALEPICELVDMAKRFERCELFLGYLEDQEEEEMASIEKLGGGTTWRRRFVPEMRSSYLKTKDYIRSRGF